MSAKVFDSDASLDERRVIIRRYGGDVEMAELPWGLQPSEVGGRPFTVVRAEGKTFPSHRCLVPASEFRHRSRGKAYSFSLADSDWFYFAGVWRPATRDWPEAYAILTIEANDDVAPFHDRQMAVLRRDQRMAWLDRTCLEEELLRPLPAGTFVVSQPRKASAQAALAFYRDWRRPAGRAVGGAEAPKGVFTRSGSHP
jgi:putative SOS response-associated peptidase YedK